VRSAPNSRNHAMRLKGVTVGVAETGIVRAAEYADIPPDDGSIEIARADAVDDFGNWHAQFPAPLAVAEQSCVPFGRTMRTVSLGVAMPLRITLSSVLAA